MTDDSDESRDTVFVNGRILTMGGCAPVVEAVRIRGEAIAAVGQSAAVLAGAGGRAEAIDLRGATVVPGLIDSHAHFSRVGPQTAAQASLYGCTSIGEVVARLEAHRDRLPDGAPILGRGDCFHRRHVAEGRQIGASDLDGVAADRPVAISDVNKTIVNSYVLEHHSQVDRVPSGVELPTDDRTGELLGVFALSAQAAAQPPAFDPGLSVEESLLRSSAEFARVGVTTVADAHPPMEYMRAAFRLARAKSLGTRVVVMPATAVLEDGELRSELVGLSGESGLVCVGPAKQFYDRFVMRRSAYLVEPYLGEPGNRGSTFVPLGDLRARVERTWDLGWPLGIHVTGDRALAEAALVLADVCYPPVHGPSHVIHAYFPTPESLRTLSGSGTGVAVQPAFLRAWGETLREFVGERRAGAFLPLSTYRRAGVTTAGGSDAPIVHWDPFRGMATAMDRRMLSGDVLGDVPGLSFEEALRLYTADAAALLGMADRIGSLEVGKAADLVVLDRQPDASDPEALARTRVRRTVVAGRTVYLAPERPGMDSRLA